MLKTYHSQIATLSGLLLSSLLHGQADIIDNNFDTVDNGTYVGDTGSPFTVSGSDANALLGNATTTNDFATVSAIGGIGNSKKFGNFDPSLRSRSTASISNGATFDFYFQFTAGTTKTNQAFVGAGFSLAAGTDNAAMFSANGSERVMIGLALRNTDDYTEAQFAGFGQLNSATALSGTPEITLTDNNWYNLSFDLSYSGSSEWTIAGLQLTGYTAASDGITASGESWSMGTMTGYVPSFGVNLDSATEAFAMITANKQRGVATLDNVQVTAIPEPSSYALLLTMGCIITIAVGRKR